MKHLIIYSHPNPKSFNHAIMETVKNVYENRGDEVVVRDLYAMDFNPQLSGDDFMALLQKTQRIDVKTEQEYVAWADMLTFIYPTWWHNLPAILKGWVDRIFTLGFSYYYDANGLQGMLTDKKAIIITTCGNPYEFIETNGYFDLYKKLVDEGTIGAMGIDIRKHFYFTGIPRTSEEERKSMLLQLQTDIPELIGSVS